MRIDRIREIKGADQSEVIRRDAHGKSLAGRCINRGLGKAALKFIKGADALLQVLFPRFFHDTASLS